MLKNKMFHKFYHNIIINKKDMEHFYNHQKIYVKK